MARQFATVLTTDGNGWNFTDTINGETLMTVSLNDLTPEQVKQAALYGIKQITADGGAKAKGSSRQSRLDGMRKRYAQVVAGTYSFRDGTGTASLPDGDIYRAVVALGFAEDSPERRERWKACKPAERRAIAKREDVRAWLEANAADDTDGDAALESFMS